MKNRLLELGFTDQMVHIYTLTQVNDATTIIPECIDSCLEYLHKIGQSDADILSYLFRYHVDLDCFINFYNSDNKAVGGLYFEVVGNTSMSVMHANDIVDVPFSKIIKCSFTSLNTIYGDS